MVLATTAEWNVLSAAALANQVFPDGSGYAVVGRYSWLISD